MAKLSAVDWEKADVASNRIVLAYELADALHSYTGDSAEQYASALTVNMIVTAFALLETGVTETQAVSQFRTAFRIVRKNRNRIGAKQCVLRDVLTEMHLEKD